jgi:hypothetical protein
VEIEDMKNNIKKFGKYNTKIDNGITNSIFKKIENDPIYENEDEEEQEETVRQLLKKFTENRENTKRRKEESDDHLFDE